MVNAQASAMLIVKYRKNQSYLRWRHNSKKLHCWPKCRKKLKIGLKCDFFFTHCVRYKNSIWKKQFLWMFLYQYLKVIKKISIKFLSFFAVWILFRIMLTHPFTRSVRFPLPLTTKNRPYYLNRIKPHFTDKVSGNGRWSFSMTSKPRSRPSASVTSPLLLRTENSNGN